jgi:hypothetical protein
LTSAAVRVRPNDLDAVWARSEPDLELDQDGRIRPIPAESSPGGGSALGAAAPVALGAIVASVQRWD